MSRKRSKNKIIAFILLIAIVISILELQLPVSAASSEIKGIDVSSKNGVMNYEQLQEQNLNFIMIRSGLGKNNVETDEDGEIVSNFPDEDNQFERNYEGAGSIGLKRGVYHVCCTRTVEGAILEAESCLEILNGRELEYPVAYDMEMLGTFSTGKENVTAMAVAFCKVIEEAGYTPMIYSSSNYFEKYFDWNQLEKIKIWVAHYGVEDPKIAHAYDIWQFSDSASVPGANTDQGKCDVNYSFMEAEAVKLTYKSITLGVNEIYKASYTMVPANCTDTVRFLSDNTAVAKVGKYTGKITAVATGTANITVLTRSGASYIMKVTVKKAPTSIKLNAKKKTLQKGKTFQIKRTLSNHSASRKITYVSSNTAVAKVSSSGLVTAKKAGIAIITVKTYNGKKTTLKVTVK